MRSQEAATVGRWQAVSDQLPELLTSDEHTEAKQAPLNA